MQLMQVPMIVGASYMATISLLPHPLDEPQTAGVNPLSFAVVGSRICAGDKTQFSRKMNGRLNSLADPKIIHPVPRIQLRGQPAWLLPTTGPRFRRLVRISEFRINSWVRSALGGFDCLLDPNSLESLQTIFKHFFLGSNLCCKRRSDFFAMSCTRFG